jgi:dihydroflavonol-4-reductase
MIVVTGASGLVGGNLVRSLLAQGRSVRALIHRDHRALDGLDVETVSADLTDLPSLQHAFRDADVVYHLASSISIRMDSWDEVERVNVMGTRNVIKACLQNNVRRLMYFGSIHAYDQAPLDQPMDEERPLLTGDHIPPYERSKVLAEMETRRSLDRGLDSVILIPTAITGPFDFRPSYFGQALQLLAKGRIPALVRGGYDWVDVRDVVEGAIQAERLAPSGGRYILSGHWHSLQHVARFVSEITDKPAPRFSVPIWLAQLAQPVMAKLAQINGGAQPLYTRPMLKAMKSNHNISHARATDDLGYSPRPFQQSIADTLNWFNDQKGNHLND